MEHVSSPKYQRCVQEHTKFKTYLVLRCLPPSETPRERNEMYASCIILTARFDPIMRKVNFLKFLVMLDHFFCLIIQPRTDTCFAKQVAQYVQMDMAMWYEQEPTLCLCAIDIVLKRKQTFFDDGVAHRAKVYNCSLECEGIMKADCCIFCEFALRKYKKYGNKQAFFLISN